MYLNPAPNPTFPHTPNAKNSHTKSHFKIKTTSLNYQNNILIMNSGSPSIFKSFDFLTLLTKTLNSCSGYTVTKNGLDICRSISSHNINGFVLRRKVLSWFPNSLHIGSKLGGARGPWSPHFLCEMSTIYI